MNDFPSCTNPLVSHILLEVSYAQRWHENKERVPEKILTNRELCQLFKIKLGDLDRIRKAFIPGELWEIRKKALRTRLHRFLQGRFNRMKDPNPIPVRSPEFEASPNFNHRCFIARRGSGTGK